MASFFVETIGEARRGDTDVHAPRVFDAGDEAARGAIVELVRSRQVVVVDTLLSQLEELAKLREPSAEWSAEELRSRALSLTLGSPLETFGAWVHYPWAGKLVHVLPSALHRELRLDRNRHKITSAEQAKLLGLTIAVAGLSVGRSVVSTFAREGIGGELRVADFDELSVSNLNRVPGDLTDVGVNKAVLAAREVALVDPYLRVVVEPRGVDPGNLDAFLHGVDVLVDECDDLAMKVALREAAVRLRIPVVMATSDRGMLDVERFDREPGRTPFHGLLDGVSSSSLRGLTSKEKVPYVLRILGGENLPPRMASSLVEVKETLSTWPQLASGVVLGGAMVADAVRRLALGELNESGRYFVDLEAVVADGRAAPVPPKKPFRPEAVRRADAHEGGTLPGPRPPGDPDAELPSEAEVRYLALAATNAPSGGNVQPWSFEGTPEGLVARLDPRRGKSLLNFDDRASVVALGAALTNVEVVAEALGFRSRVTYGTTDADPIWSVALVRERTTPPSDADRTRIAHVFSRLSNRRVGPSAPIGEDDLTALVVAARPGLLSVSNDPSKLAALADVVGELDRLQFLSPKYHRELVSEIRWSREDAEATRDGLDVAALELSATDLAALSVVRSGPAMEFLRREDLGRALGASARKAFRASAAFAVVSAGGTSKRELVDAGRSLERVWLEATRLGIAVHPWGSPFLFQRLESAPDTLDAWERSILAREAVRLGDVVGVAAPGTTRLLVLRLSRGAPATARSLRLHLDDVFRMRRGA
ncbi:MAG: Rv1355c family protein [Polyangiaceae bacterium]